MNRQKRDTRWLVSLALMAAIIVILASTPLGMIHLPVIKATTVHIPVIIGGIVLGPLAGTILGSVFGVCSLISNTITPTLLSFAFSPFLSSTGLLGAAKALWISVGCRVLMGAACGLLWSMLKRIKLADWLALPAVGFLGSMANTIFVMGSIYFLFAQDYAAAKQVPLTAVYGLIMATVTGAGLVEALAALLLVTVVGKALLHVR